MNKLTPREPTPEMVEAAQQLLGIDGKLYSKTEVTAIWKDMHDAAPSGWQPIETAPKDGRKVILFYLNRNKLPRTVMATWVTDEQAAENDADDAGLEAGWYECIDNWDDYSQVAIHEGEPTHWMPLPAPPSEKEE